MWQIQAGYPSRCLKVGVFVTQIRKGRGKSTATRWDLVLWSSSGESAVSSQLEDKEIKPSNLFLVYTHLYYFIFIRFLTSSYFLYKCLIIIYRISRISVPHFLGILCLLFSILLCLAVLWFTGSQHPSYIELPSTQHRYAVPSPGTSISRNTALVFFGACSAAASVASAMAWTVYILCISIDETQLVLLNGMSFHYYPAEVHTHTDF